jgi:hypothetical protein
MYFNVEDREFIRRMSKQKGFPAWFYKKVFELKKRIAPRWSDAGKPLFIGSKRKAYDQHVVAAKRLKANAPMSKKRTFMDYAATKKPRVRKRVHFAKSMAYGKRRGTKRRRSYSSKRRTKRRRVYKAKRRYRRKGKMSLTKQLGAPRRHYCERMGRIETPVNKTRFYVLSPVGDNNYWNNLINSETADDGVAIVGSTEPQSGFLMSQLSQTTSFRNMTNDNVVCTVYECTVRTMMPDDGLTAFNQKVAGELYNGLLDNGPAASDALFTTTSNYVESQIHKISPYIARRFTNKIKILKRRTKKIPAGESFSVTISAKKRFMANDKYTGTGAGDEAGWPGLTKFLIVRIRGDIVEADDSTTAPGSSQLNFLQSEKVVVTYLATHRPGSAFDANLVTLGANPSFMGQTVTDMVEADA